MRRLVHEKHTPRETRLPVPAIFSKRRLRNRSKPLEKQKISSLRDEKINVRASTGGAGPHSSFYRVGAALTGFPFGRLAGRQERSGLRIANQQGPARHTEIRGVQAKPPILHPATNEWKRHEIIEHPDDRGLLELREIVGGRKVGALLQRLCGRLDQRHPLADEVPRRERRVLRHEGLDAAATDRKSVV